MYSIPTSICIDGVEYRIRNDGDYRVILDCFRALEDAELMPRERLLCSLIIFYDDFNSVSDVLELNNLNKFVDEMYNFFNCGSTQSIGSRVNHKVIDWEQDEQLICSAINTVANKEIRAESYVHWWTFMGYYTAIGECPLSTIIQIRSKIVNGERLENYERKFRTKNPQYFIWNSRTLEEKEADKLAKELWNAEG